MARTNDNGQYDYPKQAWSVGRVRKRGDLDAEQVEDRPKLAMDFTRSRQRGVSDYSLTAEMERAAGVGMRGRGGQSPEAIQEMKAQTALRPNWGTNVNWQQLGKRRERFEQMTGMGVMEFVEAMGTPVEMWTGFNPSDALHVAAEKLIQKRIDEEKLRGKTHMYAIDEKGEMRATSISDVDVKAQAQRTFGFISSLLPNLRMKKKAEAAEPAATETAFEE